jgi:hypothetical protein
MATKKQQYFENIVGHWDFRQGTFFDQSPYGADLSQVGGGVPVPRSTEKGFGYELDRDQFQRFEVSTLGQEQLNIAGDLTIGLTFYQTEPASANMYLMGHGGPGEGEPQNILYSVRLNSGNSSITLLHEEGAGVNVATTFVFNVPTNRINHLAITRKTSSNEYILVFNGQPYTGTYTTNPTGGDGASVVINVGAVTNTAFFTGTILETIIFNTAMTQQELTEMYDEFMNEPYLTKIPEVSTRPKGSLLDDNFPDAIFETDMVVIGGSNAAGVQEIPDLSGNGNFAEPLALRDESTLLGRGLAFENQEALIDFKLSTMLHNLQNASFCFVLTPRSLTDFDGFLSQTVSATQTTRIGLGGTGFGTNRDILINFANGGTAASANTTSEPLQENASAFVRVEFDGSGATDADKIKLYVNEEQQTLTFNGDQATQLAAAAVQLAVGKDTSVAGTEFTGVMHNLIIFDDNLTEAQGQRLYKRFKGASSTAFAQEDIFQTTAPISSGFLQNTNFEVISGQWGVDMPKEINCEVAGAITRPSQQAYGTWYFTMNKTDEDNFYFMFMATQKDSITSAGQNGYMLGLGASENIILYKVTGGVASILARSVTSAIELGKEYNFAITRTPDGEFSIYLKGGDYEGWQLMVADTGTNPVTDTAFTTSKYVFIEANEVDAFKNVRFSPLSFDPTT